MSPDPLLSVRDLHIELTRGGELVRPVDGVSLDVAPGECLGIVGESGSGKTLTLRAILGLLPRGARVAQGEILLRDSDAVLRPRAPETLRGREATMVFQEPMTALSPTRRVGDLIGDAARSAGLPRRAARVRALELMAEVGIPDPPARARAWPHELSGGLRQRVMIAMALAAKPRLLLCDEPTTALDVTVQDQILGLLDGLRRERGLGMVFVSHDLAVVGQIAQRVAVMYAGRVVETGTAASVFAEPRHPYTRALLAAVPSLDHGGAPHGIAGSPPDPARRPTGCAFAPRCPLAAEACTTAPPPLEPIGPERASACLRHDRLRAELAA